MSLKRDYPDYYYSDQDPKRPLGKNRNESRRNVMRNNKGQRVTVRRVTKWLRNEVEPPWLKRAEAAEAKYEKDEEGRLRRPCR